MYDTEVNSISNTLNCDRGRVEGRLRGQGQEEVKDLCSRQEEEGECRKLN